jgi:signal transduction histidine kinase
VIAVADTGPGLEAAHRERAFAPLFTTKGKSHLGLGLSVVRALATRYGGEATLEAGDNGGTTLTLRLPVTTALGA